MSLLASACGDDGDTPADPAPTGADTTAPTDTAGDGPFSPTVAVTPSAVSPIAATVTIESAVPVTAQITATAADHEVATPVTAATATEHVLPLVGMRQDRTYEVAVTLTAADGEPDRDRRGSPPARSTTTSPSSTSWSTTRSAAHRASPSSRPTRVRAAVPGDFGGNAVVGLDDDNEIVWYYNTDYFNGAVQPTPDGSVAAQNDPFGMDVHAITGETLRRYFPDPEGTAETTVENGVESIPYHADWVELESIHHDLQWLDDGTVIAISRTLHDIPVEQQQQLCPGDEFEWGVLSDVIVQMAADGEVLRTWDLWDVLASTPCPGGSCATPPDSVSARRLATGPTPTRCGSTPNAT
ncbi:MAG: aryl-sulfate sulfotransferase N-terminal domain-containing protein [Acidimicrobiales bacterium]